LARRYVLRRMQREELACNGRHNTCRLSAQQRVRVKEEFALRPWGQPEKAQSGWLKMIQLGTMYDEGIRCVILCVSNPDKQNRRGDLNFRRS
jgi:hypothetical protein